MATTRKGGLPVNVTMGIHEGTLHLRRKGHIKKSKEYYATLIAASQSGLARLEFYVDEKHSLSLEPVFMVLGPDVVKVERITLPQKEMRNAFLISTREQHYTFFVSTSGECDNWVESIQQTFLEGKTAPRNASSMNKTSNITFNEIYESVDNRSSRHCEFLVRIDEATESKLGMSGTIKLVVEDESLCLLTHSHKMIVRWNYREVRKFTITNNVFSLEAGRKSSLGEGLFSFFTEESKAINEMISGKKKAMKEKSEIRKHPPKPQTFPPPPPTSQPPPPMQHVSRTLNINPCSDAIYDSPEELMISPNPNQRPSTPICHQPLPLPNQDSHHSTGRPSYGSQGISSSAVNNHNTQSDQGQIYDEIENITDAWKSHGYNDDGGESSLYSNLEFNKKQTETKTHYWVGSAAMGSTDVPQEKQNIEEDIYAEVDFSKKLKNKK